MFIEHVVKDRTQIQKVWQLQRGTYIEHWKTLKIHNLKNNLAVGKVLNAQHNNFPVCWPHHFTWPGYSLHRTYPTWCEHTVCSTANAMPSLGKRSYLQEHRSEWSLRSSPLVSSLKSHVKIGLRDTVTIIGDCLVSFKIYHYLKKWYLEQRI